MTTEFLCVGEALIAFCPADGEPLDSALHYSASVGGAESNVALALASLGHEVEWAGVVGDDPFGRRIVRTLDSGGVGTSGVRRAKKAQTAVYFKPGDGGQVRYYRRASAGSRLSRGDLRAMARVLTPHIVHTSGVSVQASASAHKGLRFLTSERPFRGALLSFDVNHRPILATPRTPEELRRIATASDIVFVGRDEAERLWGTTTPEQVRDLLPEPQWLVVKDADHEAVEFHQNQVARVPALPVAVVEPTGAGDAFAAGWLSALVQDIDAHGRLEAGHRCAAQVLSSPSDHIRTA